MWSRIKPWKLGSDECLSCQSWMSNFLKMCHFTPAKKGLICCLTDRKIHPGDAVDSGIIISHQKTYHFWLKFKLFKWNEQLWSRPGHWFGCCCCWWLYVKNWYPHRRLLSTNNPSLALPDITDAMINRLETTSGTYSCGRLERGLHNVRDQ